MYSKIFSFLEYFSKTNNIKNISVREKDSHHGLVNVYICSFESKKDKYRITIREGNNISGEVVKNNNKIIFLLKEGEWQKN